jgi:hypothetical protein
VRFGVIAVVGCQNKLAVLNVQSAVLGDEWEVVVDVDHPTAVLMCECGGDEVWDRPTMRLGAVGGQLFHRVGCEVERCRVGCEHRH